MEAKDTVMTERQIDMIEEKERHAPCHRGLDWGYTIGDTYQSLVEAQAEISFKAGIKEVVECLINDFYFKPAKGSEHYSMWQAKLKEWGIK